MTASDPTTDSPAPPEVVERYQTAHDRRDTAATLATFAADAVVEDDGHRYEGIDEIRGWLDHAASEYEFTRTLLGAVDEGEGVWLVSNRLDGNFPGGTVDLGYRFVVLDDLITHLVIAP